MASSSISITYRLKSVSTCHAKCYTSKEQTGQLTIVGAAATLISERSGE